MGQRQIPTRRAILASCCAAFFAACANGNQGPSTDHGAGALVHTFSQLEWLDSANGTFAFMRVGLRQLEVLTITHADGAPVVNASVEQMSCATFPVALGATDIDADGRREVIVSDPGCGNWFARPNETGWTIRDLSDELPEMAPAPSVLALDDCSAHGPCLAFAGAYGFELAARTADGWSSESVAGWAPNIDFMQVGMPAVFAKSQAGPTLLIHQEASRLVAYDVCSSCADIIGARNELPFEDAPRSVGFDHLQAFSSGSLLAAGVQVFPGTAGMVPRRLRLILRSGDRLRIAHDSDLEAATWTAWPVDGGLRVAIFDAAKERLYVGILSDTGVEVLSSIDVRFPMRSLPAPAGKDHFLQPDVRGADLLVRNTSEGIDVLAYDGFQLMQARFTAGLSEGAASTYTLHDARHDLAW